MKILDRYILTSFAKTFGTVFIILFFIFVLQGIWLFIAELAGKDLDVWLVLKFLAFYSPKIVPLVLPLSILLASIMTFGSFAENYEFAAMKSSGISLNRAMRPLVIFICGLSIVAFFFGNNVIPQAEYKFINLRKNIIQRKPAMAIVAGQFNPIGTGFNIKVDSKSGDNGEKLTNVTIHKRTPGSKTTTVIRSKRGLLKSGVDSNILKLELFDGYYYEEISTKNPSDRQSQPFAKSSFSKQVMNIDLTILNTSNMDTQDIAQTTTMLTVSELNFTIDSLNNNYAKEQKSVIDNISQRVTPILGKPTNVRLVKTVNDSVAPVKDSIPKDLSALFDSTTDKRRLFEVASNNVSSSTALATAGMNDLNNKIKNINSHWLALYDKFVIAYACMLMFFIGAPLGAIIRKGGLGLPIVFAVLIFIIFHFINTFGRKLAQENGIPPFVGSWMSSFVLSPLAVLLTYRATNDMGVSINFDWIVTPFEKLFAKDTSEDQPNINLDRIETKNDEEWNSLRELTNEALITIVKNARQYNYTAEHRNRSLKVLEERGITQEQLKEEGNLYNIDYLKAEYNYIKYRDFSKAALICYFIAIIAVPFAKNGLAFIIPGVLAIVSFYVAAFNVHSSLKRLGNLFGKKTGANLIVHLLFGFPFFIIIYLYNNAAVKKILDEHDFKF